MYLSTYEIHWIDIDVPFPLQVGGMFSRDEMEEICGALAMPMKKYDKTIEPNQENLMDFYKVS